MSHSAEFFIESRPLCGSRLFLIFIMEIKYGATIWARKTLESDIFFYKPDKWFKMWFYIVNKVNHRDGKLFKRGEGLIPYSDIMIATKASKPQVHKFIKFVVASNMLYNRRTTRGTVRVIVNYNIYQNLLSYGEKPRIQGYDRKINKLTEKDNNLTQLEQREGGKKYLESCGILIPHSHTTAR